MAIQMTATEIAKELGIPVYMVRRIIYHALNKIRLNLIARRCYNSEDYLDE